LKDDVWELYDVRSDFSLANDLATKRPEKLAELQAMFMKEAEKYHVLPSTTGCSSASTRPPSAGRPDGWTPRRSRWPRA